MQMIDIDISNTPEEEVLLVSDLPINRQIKFSFILPIFFFIVLTIISIFLPNAEYSQPLDNNLSQSNHFSVWNTVSQMAPIYKYLLLKFDLKGPNTDPNLNISGNISIKIYENEILMQKYDKELLSHSIQEPVFLFSSEVINFDKAVTTFNFSTPEQLSDKYTSTITTTTMSTICSLFISFIRILFSLILFFLFFGSTNFLLDIDSTINNDNDTSFDKIKKAPSSLEQKITFFLIISAFIYANPFDVVNLLHQSKFSRTIVIFLRDFFYSYLSFYIHALFSYFTRDPFENQLISLLFPYLFMAIALILFWINDADIYLQNEPKPFPFQSYSDQSFLANHPPDFPTLDSLTSIHLFYFAFLFISAIFQVIISGIKVRKNNIEHTQRWIFYSSTTITLLILVAIYVILRLFYPQLVEHTIFDQCYIFIICMCYTLMMEFGHEETDIEKKDLYVMHDDDNKRNIGQIGSINDHSLLEIEDLEKENNNEPIKPPEIRVEPVQIPTTQNTNSPEDSQK